jgi:hypothetical protein
MKQFMIISIVSVILYAQTAYSVEISSESFRISSESKEPDLDKLREERVVSESTDDTSENNQIKEKRIK